MSGILCLFSAPLLDREKNSIPLLDYENEESAIRKVYEKGHLKKYKSRFATTNEFFSSINEGYNILHLSGHGSEEYLYFENGKGGVEELHFEDIKEMFDDVEEIKQLDLITISACHSEKIAKTFIDLGVKSVVAVKTEYAVFDKFATKFFEVFYENLLKNRKSIKNSFDSAKKQLKFDTEWREYKKNNKDKKSFFDEDKKYSLFPEHRTHEFSLDVLKESREKADNFGNNLNNNVLNREGVFTGRIQQIFEVIQLVKGNRIITIKGVGGIGKTSLAMEVARWFLHKDEFEDGIYFIDLREEKTIENITKKIASCLDVSIKEEKDLFSIIREKDLFLVFDNAEDIIFSTNDEFKRFIERLVRNTRAKCLITSQKEISAIHSENERVHDLNDLTTKEINELARKKIINLEKINKVKFQELINLIGGNPLGLLITFQNINKGYSLDTIIAKLSKGQISGLHNQSEAREYSLNATMELAYEKLSKKSQELLQILSFFPSGMLYQNLEKNIFTGSIENLRIELKTCSFLQDTENDRIKLQPAVNLFAKSKMTKEILEEYSEKILNYAYAVVKVIDQFDKTEKYEISNRVVFTEKINVYNVLKSISVIDKNIEIKDKKALAIDSFLLWFYMNEEFKEGLELSEEMLKLCEQEKNYKGIALVLNTIGNLNSEMYFFEEAEKRFKESIDISEEIGYKHGLERGYFCLGRLFLSLDELDKAEENILKALKETKETKNLLMEINSYNKIGEVYFYRNELAESEFYFEKSLELLKVIDNNLGKAATFIGFGNIFYEMGNLIEAEKNYRKVIEIGLKIGSLTFIICGKNNLSKCLVKNNDFDEAKNHLDDALKICEEIEDKNGKGFIRLDLGNLHLKQEHVEKALEQYNKSLIIFQEIKNKFGIAEVYRKMGTLYVESLEYDKAEESYNKSLDIFSKTGYKLHESKVLIKIEELELNKSAIN